MVSSFPQTRIGVAHLFVGDIGKGSPGKQERTQKLPDVLEKPCSSYFKRRLLTSPDSYLAILQQMEQMVGC